MCSLLLKCSVRYGFSYEEAYNELLCGVDKKTERGRPKKVEKEILGECSFDDSSDRSKLGQVGKPLENPETEANSVREANHKNPPLEKVEPNHKKKNVVGKSPFRKGGEEEKKSKEEEKLAKKKALEEEKLGKKKALEEEKQAKKKALEEEKQAKKKALEEEKLAHKKALEEEKLAKKKALESSDFNPQTEANSVREPNHKNPQISKKIWEPNHKNPPLEKVEPNQKNVEEKNDGELEEEEVEEEEENPPLENPPLENPPFRKSTF
jgi:chromatin assembly factor 1 subunit A